jgi:hypothetical protein
MAVLPQNYSILQLFAIPPIRVTGPPMVVARRDSANHYHPPFRYDAVLMLPVTLGLLENSALDRISDFRCIRCKRPGRETQNAIDALRGLKRVSLAHHPTPVEPTFRLDRWSSSLGKRDDCTGVGTGGNKTRKIEFLMADALATWHKNRNRMGCGMRAKAASVQSTLFGSP